MASFYTTWYADSECTQLLVSVSNCDVPKYMNAIVPAIGGCPGPSTPMGYRVFQTGAAYSGSVWTKTALLPGSTCTATKLDSTTAATLHQATEVALSSFVEITTTGTVL